MLICQKCGNIYTKPIKNCTSCNGSDFLSTDIYDLQKYKCKHCNSIYRMPVKECNNCGSNEIEAYKDGRQLVHRSNYSINSTDFDSTNTFDEEEQILTMSKIIRILILVIVIPMSFFIGFSAYMDNNTQAFAPILPVLIWILIGTCYAIRKEDKKSNGSKMAVTIMLVISALLGIWLLTMLSANGYKMLFGTLLVAFLIELPIIIKKINVTKAEEKIKQSMISLQHNGLLYRNLEYDAIPDGPDKYYVQVKYSTRLDGNENVIMSKVSFNQNRLKERANLLIDTTNLNNYYIYFD